MSAKLCRLCQGKDVRLMSETRTFQVIYRLDADLDQKAREDALDKGLYSDIICLTLPREDS
jgi:hypothetical protein